MKTPFAIVAALFVGAAMSCGSDSVGNGRELAPTGTVADTDGNVYQTVEIGSQVWTVENLRTTTYRDGSAIALVTDSAAWAGLATPGYCYYDNATDTESIEKFGAYYNWYAVDTAILAPAGWHIPTAADWETLQSYLIANGYNYDGTTTYNRIAKSLAAKTDWPENTDLGAIGNDLSQNNRSGFSALPGGARNEHGAFFNLNDRGYWWSATASSASSATIRILRNYYGDFDVQGFDKRYGSSVRLIRD